MLSINFTSLVDLAALILTTNIAFVFSYHYCRVSRRASDLYYAVLLVLLVFQTALTLYSDNIVPAGVSAWAIIDGGTRNLICCQMMWVNGMLILATALMFALRYTNSPRLSGWNWVGIYLGAVLMGWFCWTDLFLKPRTSPVADYVSWRCMVPWQPLPGTYSFAPVALWLGTMAYVLYVVVRGPMRNDDNRLTRIHSRMVVIGVLMWAVGGALDVFLAIHDYFGLSPTALLGAIAMLIVGVGLAEEHAIAEKEREHVTRRFQCYVDPALVKYVIEHPERQHIEGEVRELTVVFTDLEGFTTMTERLKEGAVGLLNEYLRLMTPLIRDHNGYRNKFLGDGMMFFYGAPEPNPDHAIHAVATVLKMEQMLEELNKSIVERRKHLCEVLPKLKMRTGVSTGQMIVGDAGPEDASDYTVLGDTVNLGARLESANKAMGTRILLSKRTVELLPPDLFLVRPVGLLQVVGVSQPVMTYEPLSLTAEATDAQKWTVELTREIVEQFLDKEFGSCLEAVDRFERSLKPSKLTELYRALSSQYLIEAPSSNFIGQITLTEK